MKTYKYNVTIVLLAYMIIVKYQISHLKPQSDGLNFMVNEDLITDPELKD